MLHIFNKTCPLSVFPEDGYIQYVNQNMLGVPCIWHKLCSKLE